MGSVDGEETAGKGGVRVSASGAGESHGMSSTVSDEDDDVDSATMKRKTY